MKGNPENIVFSNGPLRFLIKELNCHIDRPALDDQLMQAMQVSSSHICLHDSCVSVENTPLGRKGNKKRSGGSDLGFTGQTLSTNQPIIIASLASLCHCHKGILESSILEGQMGKASS